MKKILIPLSLICLSLSSHAQDIYKLEALSGTDLNGTARYVGMGGAMNALGADLSTMATNPAAIGLYRRSDIAVSASVLNQPNGKDFYEINKGGFSFDQLGFVYSAHIGDEIKFINFGVNYHKRRNFKNYIGVDNFRTYGLSQSMQMLDLAYLSIDNNWFDLDKDIDRNMTSPLACLGYDTQMIDKALDENGNWNDMVPSQAEYYDYHRAQWGGIHQCDINLSANWADRVYFGITVGMQDIEQNTATEYAEKIPDENGILHPYNFVNKEILSGTGVDVKLGVIVRPIETSPFRIGLSVHTPTFYDLDTDSHLSMTSPYTDYDNENLDYTRRTAEVIGNQYKVRTPWKFNVNMATTISDFFAIDAEYEYCDYSSARVKYNGNYGYDSYFSGESDNALKYEAKQNLKAVHTFKVGAEARVSNNIYVRAGYNYVSAPLKEDAFLNLFNLYDYPEYGSYGYNNMTTNTDYVNLGEIQRVTCGIGYKSKHFYADLAYQFQKQQGDLYTFHVPEENSWENRLDAAKVDLNRHSLLFTLGYKF